MDGWMDGLIGELKIEENAMITMCILFAFYCKYTHSLYDLHI